MADRTSAEIFGTLFGMLADDKPLDRMALAKWLWGHSRGYDFSPYQMYADEALVKLGLARRGVNPRYPEDGETLLYGPDGDE